MCVAFEECLYSDLGHDFCGAAHGTFRTPSCCFSPRANFDDTATYSAVATNGLGQVSTNAAVVVRSECLPGRPSCPSLSLSAPLTLLPCRVPGRPGALPFRGTPSRT